MDTLKYMDRLASENNSQYAYRVLRSNIMYLHMYPGQIINESMLTAELNISRTPIREAIFRLREEHLVDVYNQSKTHVSLIDYNIVQNSLLIRSAVESAVFRTLCGKLDDHSRLYLLENLNRQRFYVENSELRKQFFELDNEFHKLLYDASQNVLAWEIIRSASSHLDRARYLHLYHRSSQEGIKQLYSDHKQMMDLIVENRPEELSALVDRHVKTRPSMMWDDMPNEFAGYFINVP